MTTEAPDRRAPAQEGMTSFYARIPARLAERLKAEAASERRSASAQLEVLLEQRYAEQDAARSEAA